MNKRAVILTKSYKNGGYCVAGIDVNTSDWIRFVSSNISTHGAVTDEMMCYTDGSCCEIGDIVKVQVVEPTQSPHQPENYLIDENSYWQKEGEMNLDELLDLHSCENAYYPFIFQDNWSYIESNALEEVEQSLVMVKVSDLTINPVYNGTPVTNKCDFLYRGNWYKYMSITDPDYRNDGPTVCIDKAIVIVSLPDAPRNGKFYKCVAKIIEL
mgnify:FL=1